MVSIPLHSPGGSTSITIAAHNSLPAKQGGADFICTGSNDEATILLALAKLRAAGSVPLPGDNQIAGAAYNSQGGTIYFLTGEYHIESTLTISLLTATHHVRLDGEAGATIYIKTTDETPGIVFDGQASTGATHGYNRPEILNLTIVGNFDELNPLTPHCGDLVQMLDVAYPHVKNNHFMRGGRDCFSMQTPNNGLIAPQNRIIHGNQFVGAARHGIYVSDSHDLMITDCQVEENARLTGSGGAGMYLTDIVGGTIINVMSEDNESDFNPAALDLKIVDSSLNLVSVDSDGACEIEARSGLNFKMTNCHFTTSVAMTGGNSNIVIDNCDAATSFSCLLSPANGGSFTMLGGRTGTLTVNAGKVLLDSVKVSTLFTGDMLELSVIGGYTTLGDFDQIQNAEFIGLTKLLVKSDGTGVMGVEDTLSIIGCGFEPSANYSFETHSNCRIIVQTGWDQTGGGTITFDRANSGQSGMRMTLDSHLRSPAIVISEIDYLKLTGTMTGGSISVDNCSSAMALNGMAMGSSAIINFADCTGRGVMMGCSGTGTVNRSNCSLYVDAYFAGTNNPAITIPAAT